MLDTQPNSLALAPPQSKRIEKRESWLRGTTSLVISLLTLGIVAIAAPIVKPELQYLASWNLTFGAWALIGLALLFNMVGVYQQAQIRRISRRLFEREELFRLISENAGDMIAVIDSNDKRLYNSPSYERILGYTPKELQQTSYDEQLHPDDRQKIREAAREARRTGVGNRIEYRMRHKNGTWRVVESTASATRGNSGEVEKLIIVSRDITERRQLEEQFRQVQRMEAIGRLSGGVAHDFNNLLGVVIGYSEVLQERIPEGSPLRDNVDEILKAGHRGASLTRQLLAFSRQQVLEFTTVHLNAVVSDLQRMLHRLIGEDIQLCTILDPILGPIKADQGQLEQVILNLVINARDAMPQGGKLTIMTSNFEMDEVFVQRYPYPVKTGNYVRLTVTDTGIGMDGATQTHIFEPFFTTKEKGKGTGLGLATVYGVVKQSGGYIEVQSEQGVGTTFVIYMPLVETAVEPSRTDERVQRARKGVETILLVEDEAALRASTRELLQLNGYTVLEAADGDGALETVRGHQGKIDLLLTDVVMPGVNGRDLAKKLTYQRPELKVILMSGYTGKAVGDNEVLAPNTLFLQKPFSQDHLTKKVRQALELTETASSR